MKNLQRQTDTILNPVPVAWIVSLFNSNRILSLCFFFFIPSIVSRNLRYLRLPRNRWHIILKPEISTHFTFQSPVSDQNDRGTNASQFAKARRNRLAFSSPQHCCPTPTTVPKLKLLLSMNADEYLLSIITLSKQTKPPDESRGDRKNAEPDGKNRGRAREKTQSVCTHDRHTQKLLFIHTVVQSFID